MHDKKKDESEKTPEQEALEQRVDAMMDPKRPDEPAATAPEPADEKPKITAVAAPASAATTAPQLSSKLRKKITVADVPAAKPLSIDKLDELTKKITESDAEETDKKSKKAPEPKTADKDETEKPAESEAAEETDDEEPAPAPEDIAADNTGLDDAQTDKAVDDIVAYEGDVMLAIADSTAEERNRQAGAGEVSKGHPLLSFIVWTLVAIVVVLIIVLCVLMVMGDNLAAKLGL